MQAMQKQKKQRKYLPEFVYGSIDGVITTFAVISGAMGASLAPVVILILGFANLFADGFSMAVSNFLSTRSERALDKQDGENHHHSKNPIRTAFATFVSFVFIGFIPLLSFVVANVNPWVDANKFFISIVLAGAAFLVIGAVRGHITRRHPAGAAITTLLIGGTAAAIAFGVGAFLRSLTA